MHLTHVGGLGSRCICLMPEIGDFMAKLLLTPWIQGEQETMAACEIQSHSIQGMWRAMLEMLASDACTSSRGKTLSTSELVVPGCA